MDAPNPSSLFLPKGDYAFSAPKPRTRIPRHRNGEKFLKGPIPLRWIRLASKLPGKAWHVASAIWYLVGLNNSAVVKLNQAVLDEFGVNRYAKYRALADLAKAGLIAVESRQGKNPIVTLLDPSGGAS